MRSFWGSLEILLAREAVSSTAAALNFFELAERDAELAALKAQNEMFRKMLFSPRSETLPPISSEVRNAVEADDFPIDLPAGASSEERESARRIPLQEIIIIIV